MASDDVHAAVQSVYHGALMYADEVSKRRVALLQGDERAADEASAAATDHWMRGIRDSLVRLVDRIEVLEGTEAPIGS